MNFDQLVGVEGELSINSGTATIMSPVGYAMQGGVLKWEPLPTNGHQFSLAHQRYIS